MNLDCNCWIPGFISVTSTVFIHLLTIPCSHHVRFQRGFECTDKFYGFCKEITHFLLIYVHSNILLCFVAIGKSKRQVRKKASHCGSKQQLRSPDEITLSLLVHTTNLWVLFFARIPFVVNRTLNATLTKRNTALRYFRALARFAFVRNPGNDACTTTTAFCSS